MIRRVALLTCIAVVGTLVGAQPALAVDPPFTGAAQVDGGGGHTCAAMPSGTVRCWGDDAQGQVGDDTGPGSTLPTTVIDVNGSGPLTGIAQVSAGYQHTCARTTDRHVRCWGENTLGQLGNGSGLDTVRPVVVDNVPLTGPLSLVTQVVTGYLHSCALLTNRQVRCWGGNTSGQIGDGTNTLRSSPVVVLNRAGTGPLTGVTQIAAGAFHTCARLADGTARCWGDNEGRGLGDGTTVDRRRPVTVRAASGPGPLRGVIALTGGASFTCARVQGNQARCWGHNVLHQLGTLAPGTTDQSRPQVVRRNQGGTPLTGVAQISSGDGFTCARLNSGQVQCWGADDRGQRGDGTNTSPRGARAVRGYAPDSAPVPSGPLLAGGIQITTGSAHACVRIRLQGQVHHFCWGENQTGQLGTGRGPGFEVRPLITLAPADQSE